jgi:alkanesulfonate monooxygenase SsuD/methylene tetrahydromethanopterin reductase-like flavin-dependent oxidoreductase (luciferase family)
VCLGPTAGQARAAFERSQLYHHLVSLQQSTLRGVGIESYLETNLVGTPDAVCGKIEAFAQAGASHLCGLYFVGNTIEEMMRQVRQFARDVMPTFPEKPQP